MKMDFSELDKLSKNIKEEYGVSHIGRDSKLIAYFAGKIKCENVLDIGTGTGFIGIYLAKKGKKVSASDINENSVRLAKENALRNKVKIDFILSDIFENVSGKFDLIVFNPPVGNVGGSKMGELVKSFFPKGNQFILRMCKYLIFGRRNLIKRFFIDARKHLNRDGRILTMLHEREIKMIEKMNIYKSKVLFEDLDRFFVVEFSL